ncbi:MAG: flippase [Methylococcales bacterium]|nr:flippase [Methylococcaceae bacterium]
MKNKVRTLLSHEGTRKYFFNTSWMMLEKILRMSAGVLVGIYVARYLGPDQFGAYSYALTFVALFGPITKLGMDGIIVRELVSHPNQRAQILRTSYWLKLIASFLTLFAIAGCLPWLNKDTNTNLYILIIAAGLIFQSFEIVDFYFQSIAQAKYSSICKVIQLLISSIAKIILVFLHVNLFWFVIISLLDQLALGIAYLVMGWQKEVLGDKAVDKPLLSPTTQIENAEANTSNIDKSEFVSGVAKRLLVSSWPICLYSLAVTLAMKLDQLIIEWMLGVQALGLFSAAIRFVEVWYFIPVIIGSSLFPYLINNHDKPHFEKRVLQLFGLNFYTSVFISLGTLLFGKEILVLLYGEAYRLAGDVLIIYTFAAIFVFHVSIRSKLLTLRDEQHLSLWLLILTVIMNLTLNLLFIPEYGLVGAAWAALISWASNVLIFPLISKKLYFYIKMFFLSPFFIFYKRVKPK